MRATLFLACCATALALDVTVEDHGGSAGRTAAPVRLAIDLPADLQQFARERRLVIREMTPGVGGELRPVQFEAGPGSPASGWFCWIMPEGPPGERTFHVSGADSPSAASVSVRYDREREQMLVSDGGTPVLRYNYGTVPMPEDVKDAFDSGRYAPATYGSDGLERGNYIHPLYGPDGETLTNDYPVDHPHHRGLYWAWPEVRYLGELSDLHATKNVHARPVAVKQLVDGPVFALIQVELVWIWHNGDEIVRENTEIRVWKGRAGSRFVDLTFRFTGLVDGVTVARRGQNAYGGFNMRFATGIDTATTLYTDPATVAVRRAWGDIVNTVPGGSGPVGVACFQHRSTPQYPGDWVEYPLPWYQPTFPAAGTMYPLRTDEETTLKYRLWIRPGAADEAGFADRWRAYNYPPAAPGSTVELDHLLGYSFGDPRAPLIPLENLAARARGDEKRHMQTLLLQLLNASEATTDIKVWVCEQLQVAGSDAAVPALAPLLNDPVLSHAARYALAAIPGPASAAGLRAALSTVPGEDLKIGLINTLGERRDTEAVPPLAAAVGSGESAVAHAALEALGKIGTPAAADALQGADIAATAEPRRAAALLACAAMHLRVDAAAAAARIYRRLWAEEQPLHVRKAALLGLARSKAEGATDLILTCLRGDNAVLQQAAGRVMAEIPGVDAGKALAEALPSLAPEAQVTVLEALAQRGEPATAEAVAAATAHGNESVRVAALAALGSLGSAEHVPLLANAAAAPGSGGKAAAASLAALKGDGASRTIAAALATSPPPVLAVLARATAARGDAAAVPALLRTATHADRKVRMESWRALGRLAVPDDVPALIRTIGAIPAAASRTGAEKALLAVCRRAPEGPSRAEAVLNALTDATAADRASLLTVLGGLGGAEAAEAVTAAIDEPDPGVAEAAVRALAAWPDVSAAPPLLEIIRGDVALKHRVLAIRGYVRFAALEGLSSSQSAEMYTAAMEAAERTEEKTMILAELPKAKSIAAMQVAAAHIDNPALATEAALAVIYSALPERNAGNGLVGGKVVAALERASAVIDDDALRAQVKLYIATMPETDEFNVARGRPAKGSVPSQGPSVEAKAVDGDTTLASFWSGNNTPSYLEVDFGEETEIASTHIIFYYGDSRHYQYRLDVSVDGEAWETVVDGSDNTERSTATGVFHSFAPVTARYARAHVLKNSANIGAHIVELRIFAAGHTPPGGALVRTRNLALTAAASAPDDLGDDGGSAGPAAAVDGNPGTFWDEVDGQPRYCLKLDFPEPTDVSVISVSGWGHHDFAPRDFEVVCDDTVVATVTNAQYMANTFVVEFDRTRCTSLALQITGYYGGSPGIRELGVFDPKEED